MIKKVGFVLVFFCVSANFASATPESPLGTVSKSQSKSPAQTPEPASSASSGADGSASEPPSSLRSDKQGAGEAATLKKASQDTPKPLVADTPKKKLTETAPLKETVPVPPPDLRSDEQRDFDRAAGLLKNGKEAEALVSATDFLRRYPTSRMAPEAQYLVGEIFFRQRKFKEAAGEYSKVHRFGIVGVDKASWAAVRIGECWYQLKQFERSRIEWEAVRRKFPNSEAAEAARSRLAGIPL